MEFFLILQFPVYPMKVFKKLDLPIIPGIPDVIISEMQDVKKKSDKTQTPRL
jgi:hypothetical protein